MRKPNPALIGAFLLGAVVLAVAALVVFGGGKLFKSKQLWEVNFTESIKGLAIGAPVTFHGVPIGAVTDIRVVVDRQTLQVTTPVHFEITADRLSGARGGRVLFAGDRARAHALIERGLRAQLQVQSFVTGQLAIDLDFHPGAPPYPPLDEAAPTPQIPTIPSAMHAALQELEKVDIAAIARDLRETLQGVSRLVNGPEIRGTIVSMDTALHSFNALATSTTRRIDALTPMLDEVGSNTNHALEAIRVLVQNIDGQIVPAATNTVKNMDRVVQQVNAETLPAVNQVLADVRPVLQDIGRVAGPLRDALEQAQKTLATVESSIEERSPLQYDIRAALQEITAAARSVRVLTSYLERHPDALLFGKPTGGRE